MLVLFSNPFLHSSGASQTLFSQLRLSETFLPGEDSVSGFPTQQAGGTEDKHFPQTMVRCTFGLF